MAINFPDSPSVNDIHTSGDMSWKWDGTTWKATIATSVPIPSQSGQAGEYLQTDGTNMTWEAVDALPSQTGQAGEYLKTDGTTATWEPAGGGYDVATTSTGYFDLPAGTTAQRPGSPATGMIRLNTDNDALEHYADGTWIGFAGSTPTISGIGPTTAAETGTTITVTGTNFQAGAVVKLIGTNATQVNAASTTVNSSTEIQFTTPALLVANEPYDVKVVNTNGGSATLSDILDAGGTPAWTTAAGSLGTIQDNATGTHFTLVATDPDGTAITFAETTSALTGAGLSLNSTTGAITGDPTNQTIGSPTTYAFDIDASDGVNTTSRSFSIVVQSVLTATGGTITTYAYGGINYKCHTFLASGTFTLDGPGVVDIFMIGGGGGGGANRYGGGGGSGGGIWAANYSVIAGDHAIVIGPAGPGSSGTASATGNGGNTTWTKPSGGGVLTALGGGFGASSDISQNGASGGSGGGGMNYNSGSNNGLSTQTTDVTISADSRTYGIGFSGGRGYSGPNYDGGGGGGLSEAGVSASNTGGGTSGRGGHGVHTLSGLSQAETTTFLAAAAASQSEVVSSVRYIGAGGGGGGHNPYSDVGAGNRVLGGHGFGGDGGVQNTKSAGLAAPANSGSGGGACTVDSSANTEPGGAGGSGIVVIRYAV